MTEKERLYDWICNETKNNNVTFMFPVMDRGKTTYFEDVEGQPFLEEYDIENRGDMEKYMDRYFDESLAGIRVECVRAFVKGLIALESEQAEGLHRRETEIREYIYNF